MLRIVIGGLIGFVLGMLLLAGWGIHDGLTEGISTARIPPGAEAALKNAFIYMVYFWPFALVVGGGGGAICGTASGLVSKHHHVNSNQFST